MPSFVLIVIAACVGLLTGAPRVYADATPDPMRPCRVQDVGKPCPPSPRFPPELCVEMPCDSDEDPRIIGEPKPPCYRCKYDAVADRPNRERRERARALEIAAAEREEQQLAEQKRRNKRNLHVLGIVIFLMSSAFFFFRGVRSKKS